MYDRGFVFTRPEEGLMHQTRSLRIDLEAFKPSSENRRILRKTEQLHLSFVTLPLPNYNWAIGKLAKDFYDTKFGEGTFSANKVKELLTGGRRDFTRLFIYSNNDVILSKAKNLSEPQANESTDPSAEPQDDIVGYCIAVETDEHIHYSFPFYHLDADKNTGMGMMLKAILYAKEHGKKYIYLGSAQRPGDIYKLQFAGLEWFDGKTWSQDLNKLKQYI